MINLENLEKELLKECKKKNISRIVLGAILLNEKKDSILLLKRSPNEFMPLLEELPSGKINPGESFKDALKRELLEETTLDLDKIIKYINFFDYYSLSGKLTRQFNFLVTVKNYNNIILSSNEHCDYRWQKIRNFDDHISERILEIINLIQLN